MQTQVQVLVGVAVVVLAVAVLVWVVGVVAVRIVDAVEGAVVGGVDGGVVGSVPEFMSPEQIAESLQQLNKVSDPGFRVVDPTDWTVPEPGRPKVVRIEPGEGLVP